MKKEAEELKEMTRELITAARVGCTYGVYAGAAGSAFLAGILAVVVVAIDVLCLNAADLFGTRQWSITLSLVVIMVLSLAMFYVLRERYGDLLASDSDTDDTNDADEATETAEAVGIDGTDDGFPVLLEVVSSALTCLIALAWLGGMWGFCYAAGELDTAGFGVAEVVAIETLVAAVLGVILNKVCSVEMEGKTH